MKLTNYSRGPRGIALKDGTTVWLEPGQSETFEKANLVEPLPDLGRKPDFASDEDDVLDAARREVADQAQVYIDGLKAEHEQKVADLTERAERAESSLADVQAEINDLKAKLAAVDADGDGRPGGSRAATPPALTGKNKAELLDIAKAEGVTIEEGSTNDDIKSAIELAREEAAKS